MNPTGEDIRLRRQELGMSLQELADMVGRSRAYISQIETGKATNVSHSIMTAIFDTLGISEVTDTTVPTEVLVSRLKADVESGEVSLDTCIRSAESILRTRIEKTPRCSGDLHLITSGLFRRFRRYNDSIKSASIAQEIFARSGDLFSWCLATFEMANSDYERADFITSLGRFLSIEEHLVECSYRGEFLTRLYVAIALTAASIGDIETVNMYAEKGEEGLELVPPNKRDAYRATTNYLWGVSLTESGAYKDAVDAFTAAYHYYVSINDFESVLRMKNNIALAMFKSGNIERAECIANEVYTRMLDEGRSSVSVAETLLILAQISFSRKDLEHTEKLCNSLLVYDMADLSRKAKALQLLAKSHFLRGDIEGFNTHIASAISSLDKQPHLHTLSVELMREYVTVNHLSFSI